MMSEEQAIGQGEKQSLEAGVSVITPAHNAADVVERVVESVARQSFAALEHIVIDDGSADDTLEMLRSLQARFGALQVISQPKRGAAQARNAGIEVARGRYIAFLDADDEWLPDKLARQIGFMEETGTLFSYGDYWRCRGASKDRRKLVTGPAALTYADLLRGCPIGCLTVAYNQQAMGKMYMPEVPRGHDWGLWLKLTRDGEPARRFPGVAAIYHMQSRSLSRNKLGKACDIYRIYREQEGIGIPSSLRHLAEHSWRSVF
ncbi:glycosyltransferase family 2 protein [Wenzhouxiangella sp. AB-CW3]|uniref:glycosyltransferase family 2 protein n=1 Tax=Wenzhouxiangella sp. AB-CW3 TaxID=2771012 RepID=UPI00168B272C|nr:glycosyltransferase family 2 protein [Wenzhouxiangella sp. AB-CW3]QOC23805.1 glycosyltransferase family 2 protein [Wenzhouxiangella sp. AB-CW3]